MRSLLASVFLSSLFNADSENVLRWLSAGICQLEYSIFNDYILVYIST